MKKILLFGAGYVAPPFVEYMLRRPDNFVTIASRRKATAEALTDFRDNTAAVECDVHSEAEVDALMAEHDIAVSLIPYTLHPLIIKSAVKHKKHFVSTSYISPAMAEFDQAAKDANVTILNELGVDPGIDHLYAVKTIADVHAEGGKVLSFLSYCGGLPAPEASNNPLGYKFSWSPRGVLLAVKNTGKFKENGQVVTIEGKDLLRKGAKPIDTYPAFAVEGYPNRDSTPYEQRYEIPEAHTILRGTLRYKGNPAFVQTLADIGFLSDEQHAFLAKDASPVTWRNVVQSLLGTPTNVTSDLAEAIAAKAGLSGTEKDRILRGIKWLGLLSDAEVERRGTYLDTLCATLEKKLTYAPGERDMVLLQHTFEIENKDGSKETRKCILLEYGIPNGDTAMARTVGVPCAIGVQLILDGKITRRGVIAPLTKDIYEPVLELLEKEKIGCIEETFRD
eukprot:Opistho-2@20135